MCGYCIWIDGTVATVDLDGDSLAKSRSVTHMSLIYRAAASMYAFASFFSRTDSQFSATLSLFFIVPHILSHFLLDDVCIYFASQPIARSWLMTTRSKQKYTSQSTDILVIIMYRAPIMQSINRSINQSINQSIQSILSKQVCLLMTKIS